MTIDRAELPGLPAGADLLDVALFAVRHPHAYGHRCDDGTWYNPNVGTRTPCPVLGHLDTVQGQVARLRTAVHDAAHDPEAVITVAEALLAGTGLTELSEDEAEGWMQMARQAIEGLAAHLDPAVP